MNNFQVELIQDKEYQSVLEIFKFCPNNYEIDSIEEKEEFDKRLYCIKAAKNTNNYFDKIVPEEIIKPEEIIDNFNKTEQKVSEFEEKNQIILDRSLLIGKKNLENYEVKEDSSLKKEEDNKLKNDELTNVPFNKQEKNKEQLNEQNKYKHISFNQTLIQDKQDKAFVKSKEELDEFILKEKTTKILNVSKEDNKYHLIKSNKNNYFIQPINDNLEYLSKTRETEFDNIFIEIKESNHFDIGGNEFKVFNECIENYEVKFKQKPVFKVIPLGKKRKRKSMDDLTRKKIKVHFCREIILVLNSLLKKLKIKKKFNLPQSMRTNVTKIENKKCLNMTLKEVLAERYFGKDKETDENCILIQEKNQKIFKILEKKGDDVINSILNEKMENIYNDYLMSQQFQNSINNLDKQCNSYEYIYNYIEVAKKLVKYFNSKKHGKNN